MTVMIHQTPCYPLMYNHMLTTHSLFCLLCLAISLYIAIVVGVYKSVSFTDDARLMGDVKDADVIIIDEIMESNAGLRCVSYSLC